MAIEFNGKSIETTANGYLVNADDWSEDLAKYMAEQENITLTDKHWDLIKYLREEYFNNNQNQPNTRNIVKAMSDKWGAKLGQKDVYELFPLIPASKAAASLDCLSRGARVVIDY